MHAASATPIVWQLLCADGQLYSHPDKGFLTRWVAARDALYATALSALRTAPRAFTSTAPGFGVQAGGGKA